MATHVHIYDNKTMSLNGVTYVPRKEPSMLSEKQWEALSAAESAFYSKQYSSLGSPSMGWTDIMTREESSGDMVTEIWTQCDISLSSMESGWDDLLSEDVQYRKIAQRVARVLAMIAFGEEILLA